MGKINFREKHQVGRVYGSASEKRKEVVKNDQMHKRFPWKNFKSGRGGDIDFANVLRQMLSDQSLKLYFSNITHLNNINSSKSKYNPHYKKHIWDEV